MPGAVLSAGRSELLFLQLLIISGQRDQHTVIIVQCAYHSGRENVATGAGPEGVRGEDSMSEDQFGAVGASVDTGHVSTQD